MLNGGGHPELPYSVIAAIDYRLTKGSLPTALQSLWYNPHIALLAGFEQELTMLIKVALG